MRSQKKSDRNWFDRAGWAKGRTQASVSGLMLLLFLTGMVVWLVGCVASGGQGKVPDSGEVPQPGDSVVFSEVPVPEGPWRPHRLARCVEDFELSLTVNRYLGTSSEYFRHGSGSDGMIELEIALEEGVRHPLLLMTLGQLYLMAGQGDPALLPVEGPAADVGDWPRNKKRLLRRAHKLLMECAGERPDDAAVDYLLADVARAAGRFEEAAERVEAGKSKCTGGRSFRVMKLYQALNDYPPRYEGGPPPDYPEEAMNAGITGNVVLDLLLSPGGQMKQAVVVESPSPDLTRAAEASLLLGSFEPARIGKYPIWSWLRVKTAFKLEAS